MTRRVVQRSPKVSAAVTLPEPQASWAYFFDIDGTLADIELAPEDVRIAAEVRKTIDWLYDITGGAVALVSGRSIADIDRQYPRSRMPLSGQHGVESRDANGVYHTNVVDTRLLDPARAMLSKAVARHEGLILEDKGFSLALHYRQRPQLAAYCHRLMRAAQAELGNGFAVQRGKRVVEVKPAFADKGTAMRQLMTLSLFENRMPVFVGDDVTDENGFAAANELGGSSVKIGQGKTIAKWRLRNITELMTWLHRTR
jgi:trehalose 6-phosphate phosphatase